MRVGLAALLVWLLAAPVAAQERRYDLERFRPAMDPDGFLTINGTRTPGPLRYDFGAWLGYASHELVLRDRTTGEPTGVVTDRFFGDLTFQLGLAGIVAVGVDVPFVLSQAGDGAAIDGGGPLQSGALRDPRFVGRIRILGEDATVERERHEGEGLALQAAVTAPIGHERAFAGEGAPQIEAEVIGDFHILDIGVGANLGYRHRFAEPTVGLASFRNQLYFGVGVQVPTFFLDDLVSLAEVDVTTDLENPFASETTTVVEWRVGLRLHLTDVALSAMGGGGLVGGVGSPGFRGVIGLTWSPRVHDRDHDGIVDEHDECPPLPEDFDGHEDENGCPEPDNDHDLVPDLDDACPDAASDPDRDTNDDGCTDASVDGDGDGIEDGSDACPAAAEDLDGHDDADGCPDLDDDGDGVPLPTDGCPDAVEDADGHDDADGCPDLDDDADGIPDTADACRGEAEDGDAFEPTDGCPEPDDDRDGVLDARDTCPTEAETINGRRDDDGCPDPGAGVFRRTGEPGTDAFAIEGRVPFAAGGALAPTAAAALGQLVLHLSADWGSPHVIEVSGRDAAARRIALAAALAERGITNVDVVAADGTTDRVRARRGALDAGGPGGHVLTVPLPTDIEERARVTDGTVAPGLPIVPPPVPVE